MIKQGIFRSSFLARRRVMGLVVALAAGAGLAGCASTIWMKWRDQAYSKKVEDVQVVWFMPERFTARIAPFSSDGNAKALLNIDDLTRLFAKESPDALAKALAAKKVNVLQLGGQPKSRLVITPLAGESTGVMNSGWLVIGVTLLDIPMNKEVWKVSLRVGTGIAPIDSAIVESFVGSVMYQLRADDLL